MSQGAILVNVTARSVKLGKGCIVYNITDDTEAGITLADGDVMVGIVTADGKQQIIHSNIEKDVRSKPVSQPSFHATVGTIHATVLRPLNMLLILQGGKVWKETLEQNAASFEQIYEANADADIVAIQKTAASMHATLVQSLSEQQVLSPRKKAA